MKARLARRCGIGNRPATWRPFAIAAVLAAGSPGLDEMAAAETERQAGAQYEVRYVHRVQNPTDETIRDVRVYLPIPRSDCGQVVHDWRLLPEIDSDRARIVQDQYGQEVVMILIDALPPLTDRRFGFDCTISLRADGCRSGELDHAHGAGDAGRIPAAIRRAYTTDDARMFDLKSPIVRQHAERFLAAHPEPAERAEAIAAWVASAITYERDDRWDAAPIVLKRRTGSCSEFSFVFCALCRATGLPTRFVGGSMYSDGRVMPYEDAVWHRWAQVYLPEQGWVDVDPSLGPKLRGGPTFLGRRHPRVFALTHCGSQSSVLGLTYIGANTHYETLERTRVFTWTRGAWDQFCQGRALEDDRMPMHAEVVYRNLIRRFGATRAADRAQQRLAELPQELAVFAFPRQEHEEATCQAWIERARSACLNGDDEEASHRYAELIHTFPTSRCARTAMEEAEQFGLFR